MQIYCGHFNINTRREYQQVFLESSCRHTRVEGEEHILQSERCYSALCCCFFFLIFNNRNFAIQKNVSHFIALVWFGLLKYMLRKVLDGHDELLSHMRMVSDRTVCLHIYSAYIHKILMAKKKLKTVCTAVYRVALTLFRKKTANFD